MGTDAQAGCPVRLHHFGAPREGSGVVKGIVVPEDEKVNSIEGQCVLSSGTYGGLRPIVFAPISTSVSIGDFTICAAFADCL
jgi:hypothetical protein